MVVCVSREPVKTTIRQRRVLARQAVDERAEPLKLGARWHALHECCNRRGEVRGKRSVARHVRELRHSAWGLLVSDWRMPICASLFSFSIGFAITAMSSSSAGVGSTRCSWTMRSGKYELRVAAAHARHVAVDDRAEFSLHASDSACARVSRSSAMNLRANIPSLPKGFSWPRATVRRSTSE